MKRNSLFLALAYSTAADGFQSPRFFSGCSINCISAPMRASLLSNSALFYQNRTGLVEPESQVASSDCVYDWNWENVPDELTNGRVDVGDVTFGDNVQSTRDDNSVDGNENHFFEDGTPYYSLNPTEDMLQKWTEELIDSIDLAGGFITRISVGVESMLANEFVFTSPTIGPINKQDFVTLMKFYNDNGLDIASAIPDLKVEYTGWHQDPHEPWRIWAVARWSGTHTGTATMPKSGLSLNPPNGVGDHTAKFTTGPELHSFLWTAEKELLWHTMGYVGDEYTGSNKGHGGLDGLLVSMGLPHLYLKTMGPMRNIKSYLSQFKDNGPKTKSSFSSMPLWWNERKDYDMNIQK